MKTRIMLQNELFEVIKWKDIKPAFEILYKQTKKTRFSDLKYDQLAMIVPLIKDFYETQAVPSSVDGANPK